jgi:hypothetical protein
VNIDIDLKKINLTSKNIAKVKDAIKKGSSQGLRNAGTYMVQEIRRQMTLPKTGNTYIFYKSRASKTRQRSRLNTGSVGGDKTMTYPAPEGLKIPAGSSYMHKASNASGLESSAVLTGELSKSVYTKSSGSNQQIIGATAPHAAIQEFGGANVAPRNNIRRPLAENKARIANKIQLAINNNLKGL